MKKVFVLFAAAALCLVSCNRSGLDPEEGGENKPTPEARFWDVVGNLVSMKDMTPDYKGKTFTPIIGHPDGGDESVRVVLTNNLAYAVDLFNAMTGSSITENTTTYTYSDSEVGQMVWNKDLTEAVWATVDVSIPAVPSLRKIIYRSPEQGDANGSVGDGGSAYYRFGDVISRVRPEDGVEEYWICVRPAFDPEGKGDSHFVSVSPLPDANLWPYNSTKPEQSGKPWKASNDFYYGFPTGLKDGSKWMQNLCEMLYAIYFPSEWFQNVTNYASETTFGRPSGLPIFNDFHVSNVKYHNEAFWTNVQQAWKEKGIARRVFGMSDQELKEVLLSERGMHFLHKSSSWSTSYSNKPTLYQVQYQLTTEDKNKRNMHKQTAKSVTSQVVIPNKKGVETDTNYPFDVKTETSTTKPYVVKKQFFGDDSPRWMLRFADGEELASNGKWNPQLPISGFDASSEVYRYYKHVLPEHPLTDAPEISELRRGVVNDVSSWVKTSYTGPHHYELGDVLRDDDGKEWFVIGISGAKEGSPFAEVISLSGITASNGNAVASNIVTKDQAQRAAAWLSFLFRESYKNASGKIASVVTNIRTHAQVELGKLANAQTAKNYNDKQMAIDHFSVAYSVPGSTQQHLMRYVIVDASAAGELYTNIWTHYPEKNITNIDRFYSIQMTEDEFTNVEMFLQDVAQSAKVNSYANDVIAKAAPYGSSGTGSIRSSAESRANDVTNYFYNNATWTAGSQPLGMWNEPVLFIRMAALYDRGGEYSTKTQDGRALTMVSKCTVASSETWTDPMWDYQKSLYRLEEGKRLRVPYWQDVWVNNQ